ncbi:MAG: aminoacyl-tRNA hydrolase [Fibrobacterota bacterium]
MLKWFLSLFRNRVTPSVEFVIVGVGNVGEKYENTRHNIGFMVADRLIEQLQSPHRFHGCEAEVVTGTLEGRAVAVAKPVTFVNRSGESVRLLLKKFGVPVTSCLVMVDDFNLNLGTLRLRRQGSSGGHNGLKSIIDAIGKEFPRLRLGVGPLPQNESVIDFVLGTFDSSEDMHKQQAISQASEACKQFCLHGIERTMNEFNR